MRGKKPNKARKSARKGGRTAGVLKIEGDWKEAMKQALKKGKPPKRDK